MGGCRVAAPPLERRSTYDPMAVLGGDLFVSGVLPLLDALSLARSAAVNRPWNSAASSDALWLPFLSELLASRAHLPLPLLRFSSPSSPPPCQLSAFAAFSATMHDAAQVDLSPEEMCARIWELRVKPSCGPYWYSLDPTSRGESPLLRRFRCDHSVTSLHENDPIWGGQESVWAFEKRKKGGRKLGGQRVQVNRWPHHQVIHLPDGRWRLDNEYASYTTCPDHEENTAPYLKGIVIEPCPQCCSKLDGN